MEMEDQVVSDDLIKSLDIPLRSGVYSKMKNALINSVEELDRYIDSVNKGQLSKYIKEIFKHIKIEKINFEKEVLMLFFHTETTGSAKVTVPIPIYNTDGSLKVHTDGHTPVGTIGSTADMAYYGFAYRVNRKIPSVHFEALMDGVHMILPNKIINTGMLNKLEGMSDEELKAKQKENKEFSEKIMKDLLGQ